MIIKVCGMREPQNIREVAALAINWIGFIFYERSKRFVERCPTEQQVTDSEQLSPKKVGVFVNASIESVSNFIVTNRRKIATPCKKGAIP